MRFTAVIGLLRALSRLISVRQVYFVKCGESVILVR